jgi:hypothetical protein
MKEPKRVTISDVIQYHNDKDACDMCERGEWDCPQHPFTPHNEQRSTSAVIDKRYYIGYWHGQPTQVDEHGKARSGQKLPMYTSVLAGSVREAKAKFERGEVERWLS